MHPDAIRTQHKMPQPHVLVIVPGGCQPDIEYAQEYGVVLCVCGMPMVVAKADEEPRR